MPQEKILHVRYENGIPEIADDAFDGFSHLSLLQSNGFIVSHTKAPAGENRTSTISSYHSITLTLSDLGHLDYTTDGTRLRNRYTQPNDLFLWLADRPIYGCWEKPLECLNLAFDAPFLSRTVRESVDPDRIELLGQAHLRDPLIDAIGMTLWQKAQAPGGIDKIYGETLASAFAVHTLRNYVTLKPDLRPLAPALTKTEVRLAIAYIQDNLDKDLSLANIADVAGYSVHHFRQLFKAALGKPVHQYVIEQRVEKARALLQRGHLSIGEVSALVGFYDQSHLHKHCKRILGVTPNALKRRH